MAKRRARLSAVREVICEMSRLFREARNGELDWGDARLGVLILREIRSALEGVDFEARLAALEAQRGLSYHPRNNGGATLYRPGSRPQ